MEQPLKEKVSFAINEGYYTEDVKQAIVSNVNPKFALRPYQKEAFKRFDWATGNNPRSERYNHLLFHMATGSGKTLIMAGLMLDLYEKGYRNFIFFVNSTNIIEKTRDNFLNPLSSKYLFNDTISIKEVDNFASENDEGIHIVFTTIQGLHTNLNTPRENSLTYEDFEDKKIVLLSDEAHHINAETKRKSKQQEIPFKDTKPSWENTVKKIFTKNAANYLLEFTATADLTNTGIKEKYKDKLLFDYPLKKFRIHKYSKEVQVLQADLEPFERALLSILLSQCRRKIFEKNQLHIKPVILFKSKTIKESQEFYIEFTKKIDKLTTTQLEKIKANIKKPIIEKIFKCFDDNGITLENLVLELQNDFSEDKCISINSKADNEKNQIIINSLEDPNNEYRAVFAVNMLNEGWDVLNLFDIVRLYNTRDADHKKGKIGKTTMSEAQLIGRGARYCPFKISEEQPLYQRKFDDDIKNDLRICEELYYHSAYNPQYISELNKALQEIGIKAHKTKQVELSLKDDFKKTDFYKKGVIYTNERIANDRKGIKELDESIREKIYQKNFVTGKIFSKLLFENDKEESFSNDNKHKRYYLENFDKSIIRKALNKLPFYNFNNLKRYFPHLNSISEFIGSKNYLKTIEIEFTGNKKQIGNPTPKMKLEATILSLNEISNLIKESYTDYKGTKEFSPEGISKIFGKEKTLNISIQEGSNQEYGIGQSETNNPDLNIDLSKRKWYVFNENYGTSEEKHFVKYIDAYKESLEEKYEEVFLIRNERHFKIYSFDEGKPFEPDFVLFLKKKEDTNPVIYQIFIEPKGEDRMTNDDSKIKNNFLQQIEKRHKIEVLFKNKKFKLLGMPLFNHKNQSAFEEQFKKIRKDSL